MYRCGKGLYLGKLAFTHCGKELIKCVVEIDTKQIEGKACKKLAVCLLILCGIIGASLIAERLDSSSARAIVKTSANALGLIVSGPAYELDSILSSFETIIFGESIPIVSTHRLFFFGNPLDTII